MNIHLKPELERLIQEVLQRGPYQNAGEYVERAVAMLHEQEKWPAENGSEIGAKVSAGFAAAQRGELTDGEQVKAEMNERKRGWMADKRDR